MALPVTISGLDSSAVVATRPFISSGGNVYVIGKDSGNPDIIRAFKATDPTSSFSHVGTDDDPGTNSTITVVEAVQVGDVIHVITNFGSAITNSYQYHAFDMSTDEWTVNNETITGAGGTDNSGSIQRAVSIAVRSDGDVIILHQGASERNMGTDYSRVVYSRREGGTWTVNVAVDNGGAANWYAGGTVKGSSDRMHFFFMDDSAEDGYQRTLTSANVLETFPSSFDATVHTSENNIINLGVSYDDGGTQRVRYPYGDSTTSQRNSAKLDSADAPTVSTDVDITGTTSVTSGSKFVSSFAADGTTLWHVFTESTGDDIYTQSNEDDGGWSTPDLFYAATAINAIKSNIYTRSGSVVLAMVFEDNGSLIYHEKELSAGTTDADFDMDAAAVLTWNATSTASSNLDSDAAAALTWDGASVATVSADWSSDAVASVTFNGEAIAAADLDADAVALLTWDGDEILAASEADWSSDAAASVTWGGEAIASAGWISVPWADVNWNGIATAASTFDADALAVLTWDSESTATAALDADAAASLTWTGVTIANADWTSTAAADLQWVGEELAIAASDWSSAATAAVTFNGEATASSSLDTNNTAVLTWNGSVFATAALDSDATADLQWEGATLAYADWTSTAAADLQWVGEALVVTEAAFDFDAAADLQWVGEAQTLAAAAFDFDSAATVTFNGVATASSDLDSDAAAVLTWNATTQADSAWSSAATAEVTWEGVSQEPDIASGAFEIAATAALTMAGASEVEAAWSAAATATLTMAGVEVTAAAWSAAAVATITFTGQEVGETANLDVDAAATLTWGGEAVAVATDDAIVLNGWRVKADMARELEELDEEDMIAMLTAAVAAMEQYDVLN